MDSEKQTGTLEVEIVAAYRCVACGSNLSRELVDGRPVAVHPMYGERCAHGGRVFELPVAHLLPAN